MKSVVVDASVAIKWFIPEPDRGKAESLLSGECHLLAPDLVWIEVASVAWKLTRRGALSPSEAQRIISDATAFPVEIARSLDLLPEALRIASKTDRTVYDSLYVALAVRERITLITADERLVNALRATDLSDRVELLSDIS